MSEELNIPVYIIDDDPSVRESLRYMLEGYDFQVIDFEKGADFLDNVDVCADPGCVILDSKMPGMSGQEVHDKLNKIGSTFSVIFLTGHGDVPMTVNAFRSGANDFFQKPVSAADLLPSIKKAQKSSLLRYQKHCNEILFATLTDREKELFYLIAKGQMNRQIAEKLCISVRTVEVHRAKMMVKLKMDNIAELAVFYNMMQN